MPAPHPVEVYELTGAAELRGRLHVAQPRLITSRRISAIQISAVARQAPLLLVVVSGLCSCGRPHVIGRDAQAIFRRRRHQPSRPPPAKIRPGKPAPATGPGTGTGVPPVANVKVPIKPILALKASSTFCSMLGAGLAQPSGTELPVLRKA